MASSHPLHHLITSHLLQPTQAPSSPGKSARLMKQDLTPSQHPRTWPAGSPTARHHRGACRTDTLQNLRYPHLQQPLHHHHHYLLPPEIHRVVARRCSTAYTNDSIYYLAYIARISNSKSYNESSEGQGPECRWLFLHLNISRCFWGLGHQHRRPLTTVDNNSRAGWQLKCHEREGKMWIGDVQLFHGQQPQPSQLPSRPQPPLNPN